MSDDEEPPDVEDWRAKALGDLGEAERSRWLLDQAEAHNLFLASELSKDRERGFEFMRIYGQRTLFLAFVLNSGAIAVLIALIGQVHSAETPWSDLVSVFSGPFVTFMIGTGLAVAAPALAYFNGTAYVAATLHAGQLYNWLRDGEHQFDMAAHDRAMMWVRLTQWLAVACCIVSLVVFVTGLVWALSFVDLPTPTPIEPA